MPEGSGVGRGVSVISSTRKPWLSNRARYSAALKKRLFSMRSAGMPRRVKTASSATRIAAMFPWPPHSATKRPPGFSARYTPAQNGILIGHPVQRRVGKDSVEFLFEGQRFAAGIARVHSPLLGCGNHLRRRVDAHHRRS